MWIDIGLLFFIGRIWIAALYLPLWALAYHHTIRSEEAHLRSLFGEAFDAYCAWVPRLFPLSRPWPKERAQGRIDWQNPNLTQGREYARLLGIALSPGAIWAAEWIRQERLGLFAAEHGNLLGWIVLWPALWVLKLGLAETLRRPETRLLPTLGSPWLWGRSHFVSDVSEKSDARWLFDGIGVVLSLWVAHAFGLLWLGVLPALWFALDGLDEWGHRRHGQRLGAGGRRMAWPYLPKIAAAAAVSLVMLTTFSIWGTA